MYYVVDDPDPVSTRTPEQQQRYDIARTAASGRFRRVRTEFARAIELSDRGDENPLTALERLELSALDGVLAQAFDAAADLWAAFQPDLPVEVAYRQTARDLRDDAALHEALADIAPASAEDHSFGR